MPQASIPHSKHPHQCGNAIKCPCCDVKLTEMHEAEMHLKSHLELAGNRWMECFRRCPSCDYYTIQQSNLNRHMKKHHNNHLLGPASDATLPYPYDGNWSDEAKLIYECLPAMDPNDDPFPASNYTYPYSFSSDTSNIDPGNPAAHDFPVSDPNTPSLLNVELPSELYTYTSDLCQDYSELDLYHPPCGVQDDLDLSLDCYGPNEINTLDFPYDNDYLIPHAYEDHSISSNTSPFSTITAIGQFPVHFTFTFTYTIPGNLSYII
ncbi:hypothetical protein QCA50_014767 [Cerrena zonata]|uniref:C2H2-type domain-containing protein n=1 Tax=Cerrena zonata TaxID=2478898 RepID=A0AAW0FZK7_9APHY